MTALSTSEATTPWTAGRLAGGSGPRRVLFGQMFEDSLIEQRAFAGRGKIFAIASAGCMAMALRQQHPVVACDINPVQLAYARRRLAGGGRELGDADRGMALVRRFAPLIGWSWVRVETFLAFEDPAAQLAYFHRELDTRRFRHGFDLLLSRPILGRVYAPELLACLPPHFGSVVRERMRRGFARHPNSSNPYARSLFLGEPEPDAPPSGHEVEWVEGDAASVLEAAPEASFDGFTISNILDGAPAAYRDRLFRAMARAARPGAPLVLRSFGEPPAELKNNLAAEDRALLWGVVEVRPARG